MPSSFGGFGALGELGSLQSCTGQNSALGIEPEEGPRRVEVVLCPIPPLSLLAAWSHTKMWRTFSAKSCRPEDQGPMDPQDQDTKEQLMGVGL